MVENSRSNSQDLFHILRFGSICKACRFLLSKCYPEKNSMPSMKMGNTMKKPKSMEQDDKATKYKSQKSMKRKFDKDKKRAHIDDPNKPNGTNLPNGPLIGPNSPQWSPPARMGAGPSRLSRATSHGSFSPLTRSASKRAGPGRASLLRTMSNNEALNRTFSRSTSRTGPILYSNSHGLVKPRANEQKLDCSLEELCFGCVKKIKITRDAITEDGQVVQEDETFTIKVKPGWRQGTRITFEGKGDEVSGSDPADVVFTITEKRHALFSKRDDDLELKIDIRLVEALTGCTFSVPLLGEQNMISVTVNDVISPGYEKRISGKGMPKHNEPMTRGDLIIGFSVKFPEELSGEQRAEAARILQQTC
ncbi:DnaJ homolog subfamily B member [Striga asiatica]|uniref:DnaJ homolog subfamily B member n=1 Tax=Striga asiatica TaxID=4170 RepID=A0A5A7PYK2_STRAF|nr:DnaJ homolog subfamily B member [Striga asiatica]